MKRVGTEEVKTIVVELMVRTMMSAYTAPTLVSTLSKILREDNGTAS